MPLYNISSQAGTLNASTREQLAMEITKLHVGMAGVPEDWVHICFQDYPDGHGFTAGRPAPVVALTLTIRTGRSTEYKQRFLSELWRLIQRATGAATEQIVLGMYEVPPSQAMEMGVVMPDVVSSDAVEAAKGDRPK